MSKRIWFLAMAFGCLVSLWADEPQATLRSVKGKVEVRTADGARWVPAVEGQVLDLLTMLSTGFDSSVVVMIDKTTIQVKPLTRLAIAELEVEGNTVKTQTYLRVGSVSASVKSPEGVKQDFKIHSPYSTASVRGTGFDYDGLKVKVNEGTVALGPATTSPAVDRLLSKTALTIMGGAPQATVQIQAATQGPPKEVLVPAGREAEVVLDYQAPTPSSRSSSSGDRQSLSEASGLPSSNTITPAAPSAPPRTGLKLTIELVD